ncbi:MAG TPA: glycosyltransferase [Gemmatimonadaceae bacterium]|nr:glycosyltransferase [Gemmatimonadaceae bacterium]
MLVLTHNYPRFAGDPAGAFVARLARATQAAGHETRVVTPHVPGTTEHDVDGGVSVTRFRYAPERLERVGYTGSLHRDALSKPLVALALPAYFWCFRRAARRALRDFRPDIVHSHWWIPSGAVAATLNTPFLVTSHGSDVRLLENVPPARSLARRVLGRASAITTVSSFLAGDLRRFLPELRTPVEVLPMPLDVAHFEKGRSEAKASPPRILYAGNLVQSKGVDVLIEAVARLRERGIDCELRILGEGPEREALEALSRRRGIANVVTFSPFVPQSAMPEEYGRSTVTVLPTRGNAEGLGLTLVEALLSGSAVVGTAAGGIPEVAIDGVTGLIARDGDAVHLAQQVGRLLSDLELRERLVRCGAERARERHAAISAAARFIDLYEKVRGGDLRAP